MKFIITRETILVPLQAVGNVVERRQTLPILSHVQVSLENGKASFLASDLEVEMTASVELDTDFTGVFTVPARKLLDICRALPPEVNIEFEVGEKQVAIRSGKSRFALAGLPATEFPSIGEFTAESTVVVAARDLARLVADTHFAMAQQDVRYYLNGLLLEFGQDRLRAVATDGHRLAVSEMVIMDGPKDARQVIVPRKGVVEMLRLLEGSEDTVSLKASDNHLEIGTEQRRLVSKLIDGKFPDYERVVPRGGGKVVVADRQHLRDALARTAILSNEKFRGVRLTLAKGVLKALAHNPEQEEAEEEIAVEYNGAELEIGFNVSYLLDVLSVIRSDTARLEFSDSSSSCLIRPSDESPNRYVVMPMRL
jgi:DNA polymerase-3 subunit beta